MSTSSLILQVSISQKMKFSALLLPLSALISTSLSSPTSTISATQSYNTAQSWHISNFTWINAHQNFLHLYPAFTFTITYQGNSSFTDFGGIYGDSFNITCSGAKSMWGPIDARDCTNPTLYMRSKLSSLYPTPARFSS